MNRISHENLLVEGWGTPWQRTIAQTIKEGYGSADSLLSAIEQFILDVRNVRDAFVGKTGEDGMLGLLDRSFGVLVGLSRKDKNAKMAIDVIRSYFPDGFRGSLVYPQDNTGSYNMVRWADNLFSCAKNGKIDSCMELANNPDVCFMGFDSSNYEKMNNLHKKLFELASPRTPGDDSDEALTTIAKMSTWTDHAAARVLAIYDEYTELCNILKEKTNERI